MRHFEKSPKYKNLKRLEEMLFRVEYINGIRMFISAYKNCIFVAMGAIHPYQAKKIFSSLQENIGK